jgi:trk system potassium uptake protein TrkH
VSLAIVSAHRAASAPLLAAIAGVAVLLAFAGWAGSRWPRAAALGVATAAIGVAVVCAPELATSPRTALLTGLGLIWLVYLAWRPQRERHGLQLFRPSSGEVGAAAGASGASAVAAWFVVVGMHAPTAGLGSILVAAAEVTAIWFAAVWARSLPQRHSRTSRALLGVAVVGAAVLAPTVGLSAGLTVGAIPAAAAVTLAVARWPLSGAASWDEIFSNQARLLFVTFLILCALGTAMLSLPASTADGTQLPLVDAAFTAVSAVCVTGLIVRDTAHDFSTLGQGVILLLIQLGGLGIMTFATAAIGLLGRRMSIRHERLAAELLNERNRAALFGSLRRTFLVTFGFELAATPVLAVVFARFGDGGLEALWRGLFTAVSAFCNAGFAIQTESLIPYQTSAVVLHVAGLLIIAGGLSPFVIAALPRLVRGHRADLRTRVILSTTAVLLAGAFLIVAGLEWGASLKGLSLVDKLSNAWFQCVTPRTAGFNSVDMATLRPATLTFFMILMFIGGSPGGTAGGIKTTTFFVLAMAIAGIMRGRTEIQVFGRRIPHSTLYRAAAIATLGVLSVAGAVLAIQVTQKIPADEAVFEVVSAVGTVGLTTGGTALLDGVGKVIIMLCMFLGRIGPLTAFLFLADREAAPPWKAPEEELELG